MLPKKYTPLAARPHLLLLPQSGGLLQALQGPQRLLVGPHLHGRHPEDHQAADLCGAGGGERGGEEAGLCGRDCGRVEEGRLPHRGEHLYLTHQVMSRF